jgi:hypothetical protein
MCGAAPFVLPAEETQPLQLTANPQEQNNQRQASESASAVFHDIRGPVDLREPFTIFTWLMIGAGMAIIIALLWYWRFRQRKKNHPSPLPHELALSELVALSSNREARLGLVYADRLAEILRCYIEARFLIPSTCQTTGEFFAGLARDPQADTSLQDHNSKLRVCLEHCDMAKFARLDPGQKEIESMTEAVRDFIQTTAQPATREGKS